MPEPELPDLNVSDWRDCEHFLYGIDLFNAGYWWECHEVLEGLWHASGIGSEAGHVLQAVIQCAAAPAGCGSSDGLESYCGIDLFRDF